MAVPFFAPTGRRGVAAGGAARPQGGPTRTPWEAFSPKGWDVTALGNAQGYEASISLPYSSSLKGWDVSAPGNAQGLKMRSARILGQQRGHGDPPVAPFQGFKRKQHTRMNPPQLTLGVAQGCYIPAFQAERPCQPGQSALVAAILAIAGSPFPVPAFHVGCEISNVVSPFAEMRLTSTTNGSSRFQVSSFKLTANGERQFQSLPARGGFAAGSPPAVRVQSVAVATLPLGTKHGATDELSRLPGAGHADGHRSGRGTGGRPRP